VKIDRRRERMARQLITGCFGVWDRRNSASFASMLADREIEKC
jgi:hypothetical protein